jgi:quercetin dioxygenase-like cupin family protein
MGEIFIKNYRAFEAINAKEIEEEVEGTTLRRVISDEQGARNFIMDIFQLDSGGHTKDHSHPWEHEIFVVRGEGAVVGKHGEMAFKEGDVIFIPPDEPHQIRNTGSSAIEFVCLVPKEAVSQHYLKRKLPPYRLTLPEAIERDFEFESKDAKRVFNYLAKQFVSDYMLNNVYAEKAGWCSLPPLMKGLSLKWSSVYGPRGAHGKAITELIRRGLIESRSFPQERGRGGNVTKIRIAYNKEMVKRYIDDTVRTSTTVA